MIAVSETIKEVDLKAKEKGVENPLRKYLFPLNRVVVGINDYDGKLYLNRYESE